MMLARSLSLLLCLILTIWSFQSCHGLAVSGRRRWLQQQLTTAGISTGVLTLTPQALLAIDTTGLNLRPPTPDRPQIALPTGTQDDQPLVLGMFVKFVAF